MPESDLFPSIIHLPRPEMLTEGFNSEEDSLVRRHFNYPHGLSAQRPALLVNRTLTSDPQKFGLTISGQNHENRPGSSSLRLPDGKAASGGLRCARSGWQ
jgi:hypothetical protein